MTTRPYELLVRFANNNTVKGIHVRTISTIDGKDFEGEPQPIDNTTHPVFTEFAEQFSAAIVSERDQLLQQITQLQQQVTQLQQQIDQLKESLPWNPRIMEAKAFVSRITAKEMLSLASSQDLQVQQIVGMLTAWTTNDWPIVLDSPEIQWAIPYLLSINLLDEQRASELLRDCTYQESYVADGE